MNELNPAEKDLAEALQRRARAIELGDTPLATVVSRGRHRTDRRRVAVGLAAVLTLSGTAVGTIQLLSHPVSRKVVPSADQSTAADTTLAATPTATVADSVPGDTLAAVNRVDSNLVWNAVEPGSSEALGSSFLGIGSASYQKPPYLAWSTTPGRNLDPNQGYIPQLWRSDDGIHWKPANDATFTQPAVQSIGLGSRNGRLFAFGTAAATAPIPKGGSGDLVVDVSDDQGATWRHIVLPVDLRGLSKMKGVQSIGLNGTFAVGKDAVVAIATPTPNFAPAVYQRYNGGFSVSRDGIRPINYPTCGEGVGLTATTVSGPVEPTLPAPIDTGPGVTAAAVTAPVDTSAPGPTTTTLEYGNAGSARCTGNSAPQVGELVPWSEAGVDQRVVDAMFTPRVFVSTDGDTFKEGVFPPPPDSYQPSAVPQLFPTDNGFVGVAQFYDAVGQQSVTKLYASTDGLSWSETDSQLGQVNSIQALADGTLVAFGQDYSPNADTVPWVASSPDGVDWTKRSMSALLDPTDGTTAMLNVWQMASGPSGVTAVGNIDVDMAAEAGGYSIEKDGIRLTLTQSRYGSLVATDIASGAELGRFDGRVPPAADSALRYGEAGGMQLFNADGTLRVAFSDQDMQGIYSQQATFASKVVILHSTDGVNWSRDDVKPLVGFESYGGGRVQVTDSNVLVSVIKPVGFNADGTSTDPAAIPKTVVLVGTPKS
jgi:hypothetical protein